jgi:uncharacterized protein
VDQFSADLILASSAGRLVAGFNKAGLRLARRPVSNRKINMQKPLRRKDREIQAEEAKKLLAEGAYGVLATVSGDGQPYAVPLSYVFHEQCLYFHCAREGQKIDNIRANPAVSFCVVGATRVLPDKFSTEYESALAFGRAEEVSGSEKKRVLEKILEKYSPEFPEKGARYLEAMFDETLVVRMTITALTGKARR